MKDRILYIHPSSSEKRESQVVIPIGMVGLANIISSVENVEFKAVSIPLEEYLNPSYNILEEIKEFNPKIVMVDLHWAIYSYSSIEICKAVKEFDYNITTILGGITASIYFEEIISEYNFVDYIIRGDAEKTIESLIKYILEDRGSLDDIPNIVYKRNGSMITNDNLKQCTSFDNLNFVNYDFLKNKEMFFKKQGVHKGVAINNGLAWIPTARGCNCNCTYCGGNKNMFKAIFNKQTMLLNSPANITGYMQEIYDKYGVDVFGITHTFEVFPKEFQKEIIDRMRNLTFKPGLFYYLFQLPKKEQINELLSVVNQRKTVIGLSSMSGDENIRAKNGKPFTNQELFEFLDMLKDSKVKIELYFMDNLKYSNDEAFKKTKNLIEYLYTEYKEKYNMNIEISYGFEIIQPLSEKHKENCILKSFKDYYYRYSPEFDLDISKGKNKEYLIGEQEFDRERYKRLKEINSLIFDRERKYNENVDIIYVCPPSCKQKEFEKTIGLAYLEAYIKKNGYTSKQLIPASLNVDDIAGEIIKENPKFVGFSIYDTNYYYCKLLAIKIKEANPNIIIMAGGPTATFNADLIMTDSSAFDYCQKGYGEFGIIKLLNYELKFEGFLEEIEGLVYRDKDKIIHNKIANLPTNIDMFPSPYLSDIDFFPERKIVLTSRGCIHNCVYCNCKSMCNKRVYYHSVERVIDELKYISDREKGAYVLIGDDAFTLDIKRAKEICRKIIGNNIKLNLFCETRVDRLDDELLDLLKKAGFIKMDFGLESAVPKILRNVQKLFYNDNDTSYEKEKEFLNIMKTAIIKTKKLNLDPMVNIITGLPGEDENDAKKTLEYIKELGINSYSHNYLRIYAGTELYTEYKKWGYNIKQDAYKLPLIIEYPYDVNKIKPLNNSVNRNEIVRIKNNLIDVLKEEKRAYKLEDFDNENVIYKLKEININEEIFVWINDIKEADKVASIFAVNLIPTNNINYIIDTKDYLKSFNNLDRENYILAKKVYNEKIELPNNYHEFLYVEEMNDRIKDGFNKIGVNPYVNKFVVLKGQKNITDNKYWKEQVEDYCNLYDKNNNDCISKFLEHINYDVDKLNMDIFRNIVSKKVFNTSEIKTIIKFLKYYLLGVIDSDR